MGTFLTRLDTRNVELLDARTVACQNTLKRREGGPHARRLSRSVAMSGVPPIPDSPEL